MELEQILVLVTAIVTFVLGFVAKKVPFINNHLIPVQNLCVGVIVTIIYWIITKDFSLAITTAGLFTGGVYDILHNLEKLREEK
jgi:hypothetical protein